MSEGRSVSRLVLIAIAVVCIGALAAVAYLNPFGAPEEHIDWNVTLIGSGGDARVLTFDELKALPPYEGYGGFFTTVGIVNGPYKCKGVPIKELGELVGGIDASNTVWVSAPDGYLMAFSYDQVNGNFRTFDQTTFREVPHDELTMILMYEQDGAPLSDYDGRPVRIAIVSARGDYLTEGSYWVKWVDEIEVRTPASTNTS
ncbi:MAG: molybdopterin-dependent oxidoreductase [Methanomicrobia archaeon]|nr:molybdopterin-dependent oxidoreductase [Methanomicrobia archaeon]